MTYSTSWLNTCGSVFEKSGDYTIDQEYRVSSTRPTALYDPESRLKRTLLDIHPQLLQEQFVSGHWFGRQSIFGHDRLNICGFNAV